MNDKSVKRLFLAAGIYDLVLGLVFVFFFKPLYAYMQVPPPNHDAYILLPGLLVVVFGIGFLMVSADPQGGRQIMLLGVLMKLVYCGTVLGFWFSSSIPVVYLPFAWIDLLFVLGFLWAYRRTGPARPAV